MCVTALAISLLPSQISFINVPTVSIQTSYYYPFPSFIKLQKETEEVLCYTRPAIM